MNYILMSFILGVCAAFTLFFTLTMGVEVYVIEACLLLSGVMILLIYWVKRNRRVKFLFIEDKRIDAKTSVNDLEIKHAEYIRDRNTIFFSLAIVMIIYIIVVIVAKINGLY